MHIFNVLIVAITNQTYLLEMFVSSYCLLRSLTDSFAVLPLNSLDGCDIALHGLSLSLGLQSPPYRHGTQLWIPHVAVKISGIRFIINWLKFERRQCIWILYKIGLGGTWEFGMTATLKNVITVGDFVCQPKIEKVKHAIHH